MWLASVTEKPADVPLNFTPVAPVKFVPVIVTPAPTCPLVGEKLVTVGLATFTVKLLADVAVPFGVTREIFPVTAALGTVNVALVALATENVAGTPPTVTEVVPAKFVPVRVTVAPIAPLAGLKFEIVGDEFSCVGGGAGLTLPLPHPAKMPAKIALAGAKIDLDLTPCQKAENIACQPL